MVQELATSKQTLSQRVQELTQSLKSLLIEMHYIRDKQSLTLDKLNKMINGKAVLPMLNILDANNKCQELLQIAFEKYVGNVESSETSNCSPIFCNTPGEAYAQKVFKYLIKTCIFNMN